MTLDELRQRATVTVAEAASVLGVSRPVAFEWVRQGTLPSLGTGNGGRVVIPAPALLTMLGAAQPTDGKVITAEQLIVALEAAARALRQSIGE